MLILAAGIGLTTVWLVNVRYRRGSSATQLGPMSQSWVEAYQASEPSRSE
jgi:hypothetical protein